MMKNDMAGMDVLVMVRNLRDQLVRLLESNNSLLVENLRLWKENSELGKIESEKR